MAIAVGLGREANRIQSMIGQIQSALEKSRGRLTSSTSPLVDEQAALRSAKTLYSEALTIRHALELRISRLGLDTEKILKPIVHELRSVATIIGRRSAVFAQGEANEKAALTSKREAAAAERNRLRDLRDANKEAAKQSKLQQQLQIQSVEHGGSFFSGLARSLAPSAVGNITRAWGGALRRMRRIDSSGGRGVGGTVGDGSGGGDGGGFGMIGDVNAAEIGGLVGLTLYELGKLAVGLYKFANNAIMPAKDQVEALAAAGRRIGVPTGKIIGMAGAEPGHLRLSPELYALGLERPSDVAALVQAYGLRQGVGTSVRMAAVAEQSEFMNFQSREQWATFFGRVAGYGLAGGAGGLERVGNTVFTSVKRGMEAGLPSEQTFDAINKSLETIARSGTLHSYADIARFATAGQTSALISQRTGANQAQTLSTLNAMMNDLPNNPLLFNAFVAALTGPNGEFSATPAAVNRLRARAGVPAYNFTPEETAILKQYETNPVLAHQQLVRMRALPETDIPREVYDALRKGGRSPTEARGMAWLPFPAELGPTIGGMLGIRMPRAGAPEGGVEFENVLDRFLSTGKMGPGLDDAITRFVRSGKHDLLTEGPLGIAGMRPTNILDPETRLLEARVAVGEKEAVELESSASALHAFAGELKEVNGALAGLAGALNDIVRGRFSFSYPGLDERVREMDVGKYMGGDSIKAGKAGSGGIDIDTHRAVKSMATGAMRSHGLGYEIP